MSIQKITSFLALSLVLISASASAQATAPPPAIAIDPIRIACVGDSLTAGYGAPSDNAYTNFLPSLLNGIDSIRNLGSSGATLSKKGDLSYWNLKMGGNQQPFSTALGAFEPDIVLLMLGSNDAKPQNWRSHDDFISDYTAMVNILRSSRRHPTVYAMLPTPFPRPGYDITPSAIQDEVLPAIKDAAAQLHLPVIDLNSAFKDHPEFMGPDGVHPNVAGYKFMAQTIANALSQIPVFPVRFDIFSTSESVSINVPPGSEIRYTLDGTLPTANSSRYQNPISLDTTTTIVAAVEKDGKLGLPTSATFVKGLPAPATSSTVPLVPGLTYSLYQGQPGNISGLDWDEKYFVKKGNVSGIDFSPREQKEWFAFNFSGFITVPSDGLYTFSTTSSPGSNLSIDGEVVVQNEGFHPPREASGRIALQAGPHAFNVRSLHAAGPGDVDFKATWEGPGISKQEIPATAFSHAPESAPNPALVK